MQKSLKKISTAGLVLLVLPTLVFAAAAGTDIKTYIDSTLKPLIGTIVSFLLIVATLVFVVSVIRYIAAGGDEAKRTEARQFIVFALIGLVVIIGLWGFVNIIVGSIVGVNTSITSISY